MISGFNSNAVPSVLYLAHSRSGAVGTNTILQNNDGIGYIDFYGANGTSYDLGARIGAEVDGTPGVSDMPSRLVFSVTADAASSPTEALRISNDRSITVSDGGHVVLGTTTGTKIGTATTQKLGFWDKTPVVQPTTGISGATFVVDSGGSIHPTSTFDGYTIAQVVAALRQLGILA